MGYMDDFRVGDDDAGSECDMCAAALRVGIQCTQAEYCTQAEFPLTFRR